MSGLSMKAMDAWLEDLRFAFWLDVVKAGDEYGPDLPCFLAAYDDQPCDGRIEAAHWIKRQRIEKTIAWNLGVPEALYRGRQKIATATAEQIERLPLVHLAAWDPRLAVPGCTRHHRRFDSQATPPLWVFREEVPWEVEDGVTDWGLETALEDRSPFFDPRVPPERDVRNVSPLPEHERQRQSIAAERKLWSL